MMMVKGGFSVRRFKISGQPPSNPSENSGSSSTTVSTVDDEAQEGVIYVRVHNIKCAGRYPEFDWFCLRNDTDMSHKPPICVCGAVEDLKPVFVRPKYRPKSSIAALGQFIYVFGGVDINNHCTDCAEVSYIDTHNPHEGWKVCEKEMPKARALAYPITLDKDRVLLVGGFLIHDDDQPFSQMYNSSTNEWSALENKPIFGRCPFYSGNGVVVEKKKGKKKKKKKKTTVLFHRHGSPCLYTYNLNQDLWGILWDGEFGESYLSGTLVDGVYYVIDEYSVLSGYDISEEHAKCLPVEILVRKGNRKGKKNQKEWLPLLFDEIKLLAIGDSKLAMVWYDTCCEDMKISRLFLKLSVFEMMKEDSGDDCKEKLVARPVSHVCYHINDTELLNELVTVFPSNCGPNTNPGYSATN